MGRNYKNENGTLVSETDRGFYFYHPCSNLPNDDVGTSPDHINFGIVSYTSCGGSVMIQCTPTQVRLLPSGLVSFSCSMDIAGKFHRTPKSLVRLGRYSGAKLSKAAAIISNMAPRLAERFLEDGPQATLDAMEAAIKGIYHA